MEDFRCDGFHRADLISVSPQPRFPLCPDLFSTFGLRVGGFPLCCVSEGLFSNDVQVFFLPRWHKKTQRLHVYKSGPVQGWFHLTAANQTPLSVCPTLLTSLMLLRFTWIFRRSSVWLFLRSITETTEGLLNDVTALSMEIIRLFMAHVMYGMSYGMFFSFSLLHAYFCMIW